MRSLTRASRPRPLVRARARLVDPRLLVGLALVVGSVAGVVMVVSAADDTQPVYAATRALAPGQVIEADDLELRDVSLAAAAARYLTPDDLPAGAVVARTIGAGELVPLSAVADAASQDLAAVVVTIAGALPGSVDAGGEVDVWATRIEPGGEVSAPAVIVPGAIVVERAASDSIVSGGQSVVVELLVPRERVARVVEAMARGDALALVPSGLPLDSR